MFYRSSEPSPEEDKRGCRDVWLLTRAAFGILLIPLGILCGALIALALVFYLFSQAWYLGLMGIALIGGGIYAYARWERRHFRVR